MSNYVIETDHDGYRRLRALADLSQEEASAQGGGYAMPNERPKLEAAVRETLTALVDADFAERYLAEPLPRPPLNVRIKAQNGLLRQPIDGHPFEEIQAEARREIERHRLTGSGLPERICVVYSEPARSIREIPDSWRYDFDRVNDQGVLKFAGCTKEWRPPLSSERTP